MVSAEWAAALGTWAAALATFAAVCVALWESRRSRKPKLTIWSRLADLPERSGMFAGPDVLAVTVSNTGHAPTEVRTLGYLDADGYQMVRSHGKRITGKTVRFRDPDPLPKYLAPGESVDIQDDEYVVLDGTLFRDDQTQGRIIAVIAYDSYGRRHFGSYARPADWRWRLELRRALVRGRLIALRIKREQRRSDLGRPPG